MLISQIYFDPDDVSNKARAFKSLKYEIQVAETVWMPLPERQQQLKESSEQAQKISKVIDELKAEEEVTGLYSNAVFET